MTDQIDNASWGWNHRNLLAIALLATTLAGIVGWRAYRNRAILLHDLTTVPMAPLQAQDTIDPNTADWPSLARLPGVGPATAQAVCAYRKARAAEHPGETIFSCPADLQAVPGIGPKTAERIAPYLFFPAQQSTTLPTMP